ncbi:GNAT family N-acetyltransferase [Acinetobacter sp. NIPH 298]|uniref:GNAT family N-acetyltransferase n=1 Tax=Acinetobacter sp. NIPH 298 TaxID=1217692 RepID=UPI0003AAFB63|nr:GNAT family N-acetyltransferase [Acinetobacter sp. NIPH 298]
MFQNQKFISALANEEFYLHVLREEDANDVYEAIIDSLAHLQKYPATIPWVLNKQSLENTRLYCQNVQDNLSKNKDVVFVIRHKKTERLIGLVGLHNICWEIPRLEIGFWGNIVFNKQGLMKQAIQRLLEVLQVRYNFKRIEALVDHENQDARKLCERLGFQLESIMRNALRNPVDRSLRHLYVYTILTE